ncbi:hypothetical protein TrispH2_006146 [Trichoplax sp. H2]|nr:hypothetical protein TrispH2_006146 [Trichoplax sp. H2]|eukprot:RDD41686.1 hypothetical protein TrispH2_006146 [Trichoplax sp. H2]
MQRKRKKFNNIDEYTNTAIKEELTESDYHDDLTSSFKRAKRNGIKYIKKEDVIKEFTVIPSIGKSLAEDMYNLDINSIEELKMHHPDQMYAKLRAQAAAPMCRCVLYAFRCAVYYASIPIQYHDKQLLKWSSWSDKNVQKLNLNERFKHLF